MAKVGYNNSGSYKPELTVVDILKMESEPWEEVGLRKETLERFGVKVQFRPEDNGLGNPIAIYFPTYNQELTKVIGYQKKDLTIDKNANYHFTNIGTVNCKNPMFFQNLANQSAKHVYICEGPKDAMCLWQTLYDGAKEEYKALTPPVVSILLGTPNAKKNIVHNEDFIKKFRGTYKFKEDIKRKGPILCFDNDESAQGENEVKGREATQEVAAFLRDEYVQVLKHPEYINDIGDYLKLGKEEKLFNLAVFQTEEYKSEKIVSLYDVFEPGELIKPIEKGVYLPSYPKLMDLTLGERTNELTLLLAPSGAGKSTVSADMLYEYIYAVGYGGGIFLEENLKKTFQRFIARRLNINLRDMRLGLVDIDPLKYKEAEEWVANPNNFMALNHGGAIAISELDALARMMVHKHKRRKIVFDHLTLATSDSKRGEDERLKLDKSMTMLAALCEQEEVNITVVCHVNRGVQAGRNRDIKEPTWRRCFKEDARGSSSIECLSWNVFCLDIEELPNSKRGRVRISCQKNREAGDTGFADIIKMNNTTGVMEDASMMEYDDTRGLYLPGSGDGY